jgi:hypothetical protein
MITLGIVLIIISIIFVFVMIHRYTYGDPFKKCGRVIYVEN